MANPSVMGDVEPQTKLEHDVTGNGASTDALGAGHPVMDEKGAAPAAPASTNTQQPARRSKASIALIMLALGMGMFLYAIDTTIVTTALPTISQHFHSASGYTWIGSAFLLASAVSIPIWGKLSDIWGRKPILLLANSVFFLGSLLAGVSRSIGMLIAARVLQGLGGGGLVTLAQICISDLFSIRERGAYFGILGGVWALASAIGPMVGGVFTDRVSWRWCFYINLPLSAIAIVVILLFLDIQTPKTPLLQGLRAIDWLGAVTFVGAMVMLLLGLVLGGVVYPWASARVLGLLVAGAALLVVFGLVEWKVARQPIMPVRIFQHRSNIAALAVCFFHGACFIGTDFYLPLYFQAARGATPLLSGVYLLPSLLTQSVVALLMGLLIPRTGAYLPFLRAGLVAMLLGHGLYLDLRRDSSWPKLILYQMTTAVGYGPNFQAPLIALQTLVAPRDIATATATFGFVRALALAVSVAVGAVVFNNAIDRRSRADLPALLGPGPAAALAGARAGASIGLVDSLPQPQKRFAQTAYAQSLRPVWFLYLALAVAGLAAGCLVTKQKLSREHQETKTGLHADSQPVKAEQALADCERDAVDGHVPV